MMRIKSFAIECAVDFFNDFRRGISQEVLLILLFPAFSYDIIDRIPELLSFVYTSRTNYFCQRLLFLNLDSV